MSDLGSTPSASGAGASAATGVWTRPDASTRSRRPCSPPRRRRAARRRPRRGGDLPARPAGERGAGARRRPRGPRRPRVRRPAARHRLGGPAGGHRAHPGPSSTSPSRTSSAPRTSPRGRAGRVRDRPGRRAGAAAGAPPPRARAAPRPRRRPGRLPRRAGRVRRPAPRAVGDEPGGEPGRGPTPSGPRRDRAGEVVLVRSARWRWPSRLRRRLRDHRRRGWASL